MEFFNYQKVIQSFLQQEKNFLWASIPLPLPAAVHQIDINMATSCSNLNIMCTVCNTFRVTQYSVNLQYVVHY